MDHRPNARPNPTPPLHQAELPGFRRVSRGKVRDIFEVGDDLLIVTTDRISAFDCVLPDPIPDKGKVLNQLSLFWFRRFEGLLPGHVITGDVPAMPDSLQPFRDLLAGRSMLVRRAKVLPVECIVRGYLAGSGWQEYQRQGTVCGIAIPEGLAENARLPEPLFTPSTKAVEGHDENIPYETMSGLVGEPLAGEVRRRALELYARAAEYALGRGIIIADTKFEFGLHEGKLMLVDEVLTPDSSRFWPADGYAPGRAQPSFDKQFVRDWLTGCGWDRNPPAPALPADVIARTTEKYREAYRRLTGEDLAG
jgi:phosphoribosylaminoimidazole-succinocarboxamide synthase